MLCINREMAAVVLLHLLLSSILYLFPFHLNNEQNRNIKKILFIIDIMGNDVLVLRINNTGFVLICGDCRVII